jgi:hypothetical protein
MISNAAPVRDFSLLPSHSQAQNTTLAKPEEQDDKNNYSTTYVDSEAYEIITQEDSSNSDETFKFGQLLRNNQSKPTSLFFNIFENLSESDSYIWRDLSTSILDINESLNAINQWASQLIDSSPNLIELSSLSFRNNDLLAENISFRPNASDQDNEFESGSDILANQQINPQYGGLIEIFTSPIKLLRLIAEHFSLLVAVFSVLLAIKLVATFIFQKSQRRLQRRKSRRKRSIDGYIK